MPDGWLLAILVLLGVLALQVVVVVAVQRLRDTLRRRRGLPSIAEQRQRHLDTHGDERLVPIGLVGLPGVILPGGRRGAATGRQRGGSDRPEGSEGSNDPNRTDHTDRGNPSG